MKRQSNEWRHYGSPRKSKVRQNPSNVKVMVTLMYDCDGVILMHTVNAQYYCSLLENLRPALRKKRRHFLQNPPIILQDNARPHAAQAVADLFDRWGWEVLYHPPYSPDLSPCDFDLIPKMKEPLRGIRFKTVPEIIQAVNRSIRTINTTGAAKGILRLPHRLQRVVHNAGDYTERQ
jgi:histone-lysine N-methyltransferase SETMAR